MPVLQLVHSSRIPCVFLFVAPTGQRHRRARLSGRWMVLGKKSPETSRHFFRWDDFSLCTKKKAAHGSVHLIGQLFSVSQQKIEKTASPREKRSTTSVHGASPLAGDAEKRDKKGTRPRSVRRINPHFSHRQTNSGGQFIPLFFCCCFCGQARRGRTFCLSTLDPFFPLSILLLFPLVAARANTSPSSWSTQQTPTLDRRPIPA